MRRALAGLSADVWDLFLDGGLVIETPAGRQPADQVCLRTVLQADGDTLTFVNPRFAPEPKAFEALAAGHQEEVRRRLARLRNLPRLPRRMLAGLGAGGAILAPFVEWLATGGTAALEALAWSAGGAIGMPALGWGAGRALRWWIRRKLSEL